MTSQGQSVRCQIRNFRACILAISIYVDETSMLDSNHVPMIDLPSDGTSASWVVHNCSLRGWAKRLQFDCEFPQFRRTASRDRQRRNSHGTISVSRWPNDSGSTGPAEFSIGRQKRLLRVLRSIG